MCAIHIFFFSFAQKVNLRQWFQRLGIAIGVKEVGVLCYLHVWHQPVESIFREGIAGGGSVYLECHWGEFVPSCRHWQGNKVLLLGCICVDTVYLRCFQGAAPFLVVISVVFHRVLIICRV